MKLLKVLFTLILLSSSVAASANDPEVLEVGANENVTITKWHVHFVNNRSDSGNMIVGCAGANLEITLASGSTHKCSGSSTMYGPNSAYYRPVPDDNLSTSTYGNYSHSTSCKDFENLLTITGTGDFDTGKVDDVCSQDLTLDGISEN